MFLAFLLFSCCIVPFSAEDLSNYLPSDNVAIDCSPPDPSPYFSSDSDNIKVGLNFSTVSRIYALHPDNRERRKRPKISACLFREQFTYTFSVSVGPKFIRLHFVPVTYQGLNLSKALFSVSVGGFTLLNASETSYSKFNSEDVVIREFCINSEGRILNVTLTPSAKISGAYAFVNKIEIVSMPSKLYIQENVALPFIGHPSPFYMQSSTATETMYRINIGGDSVPPPEDSGMFRLWSREMYYLMSNEGETSGIESQVDVRSGPLEQEFAAPIQVYASARTVEDSSASNSSARWSFPVESGFHYLVRLHFCEISREIKLDNQRVFQVYINNQKAEDHANVFSWTNGSGIPIYRDYIVNLSRQGEGIKYVSVSMRSCNGSLAGPILNGLEILKLSDLSKNLAGRNPFGVRIHPNLNFLDFENNVENHQVVIITWFASVLGWIVGATGFFGILFMLFLNYRNTPKQVLPSNHCRIFTIAEIKSATSNFSDAFLIGSGGFGMVYKGSIDCGTTNVAIKRAKPNSRQGLKEFETEISMLSKLRHCHLVSLIGYAMKDEEMILVYEYMAQGTLRDHLYKTRKSQIPWKQRLKICIGAARGIHYLHTGTKNTIIHRDIKSSNILLDDNLVAKVSDFGLSKVGHCAMVESKINPVSTMVKGTFGYLDPEYFRRQKLTEKSDVYSFGVVLFEVLCGRPAVMTGGEIEEEEYEKVNLAEWALNSYRNGNVDQIIDPYLKGKIAPECFKTFIDIAIKCLGERGSERPSMGNVLGNLELAIQQQIASDLQECTAKEGDKAINSNGDVSLMIDKGGRSCFHHSDKNPGEEFSEIMFPIGR